MNSKLTFILASFLLFAASTNAQNKEFTLRGMIGGLQDQYIYLIKDSGEDRIMMDSTRIVNGEFELKGEIPHDLAVRLKVKKHRSLPLFISPGEMNLLIHKDSMRYQVVPGALTGSKAQNQLEEFMRKKKSYDQRRVVISNILDTLDNDRHPEKKKELITEYRQHAKFEMNYILEHANSPVAQYLFYKGYYSGKLHKKDLETLINTASIESPSLYMQNLLKRNRMLDGLQKGGTFPKLEAQTLTGEKFQLEKLRGKYVLVYIYVAYKESMAQDYIAHLKHLSSKYPREQMEIVNIIRYTSFQMPTLAKSKQQEIWKPTPKLTGFVTEIPSLDSQVELVRYVGRRFNAYLLDPNGKVLMHMEKPDATLMEYELNKFLQ